MKNETYKFVELSQIMIINGRWYIMIKTFYEFWVQEEQDEQNQAEMQKKTVLRFITVS